MGIGIIGRLPRLTISLSRIGISTMPIGIGIGFKIILIVYIESANFLVDRNFIINIF